MQSYIKLNNTILDCGLSVNELKVAVYLYSCVKSRNICCVKQSTIANRCGFKQVKTVSGIICRLIRKGVIKRVYRPHKSNGYLGTYIYTLKEVVKRGYFKVNRNILNKLSAVELRMFLFICRAVTKKNDMWNSYKDISRILGIKRENVIETINALIQKGVIIKKKILKNDGSYSDNHYSVKYDTEKEKSLEHHFGSKMFKVKEYCKYVDIYYNTYYNSIEFFCQEKNKIIIEEYMSGVVP